MLQHRLSGLQNLKCLYSRLPVPKLGSKELQGCGWQERTGPYFRGGTEFLVVEMLSQKLRLATAFPLGRAHKQSLSMLH